MHLHIIISGHVQGVFFRAGIEEHAIHHHVTGWVRNNRDGSVEAVFEGTKEALTNMLRYCKKGPMEAQVADVQEKWKETEEGFGEFKVAH